MSQDHSSNSDGAPPWRVIEWPSDKRQSARKREQTSGSAGDAFPHDVDSLPDSHKSPSISSTPTTLDPRRKALELLTRREHSRRELTNKLTARGIEPDTAQAVVEVMHENGWQDDRRFAEALVRARMASGQGPIRIRAELQYHGLSGEIIQTALELGETDWNAMARALLIRRFGASPTRDRKEIARRGAFLQRRGFDLEAIRHALSAESDPD